MIIFGSGLDSLLRHACSSTMLLGAARHQLPLGNSLKINLPLAYMKVDLNDLVSLHDFCCYSVQLRIPLFFHFRLGKVLLLVFHCVTFS